MLYYQYNDNQNGYTNTDKTDLFRQRGFFFILYLFSLGFLMFDGSGFLISFDICSIGYHRLFILLLVEITFHMTVNK